MTSLEDRWSDWTPGTPVSESNTPKNRTDKTDKIPIPPPSDPFDGSLSKDISPEQPDLTGVIPVRNGSPLEQLAYEVRDTRLIAECRGKAVELQTWLVARFDEHMTTELGLPEWISTLAEFDIVERGQLRGVFHYAGCIHDSGSCPDDAPVCCSACEGKDQT